MSRHRVWASIRKRFSSHWAISRRKSQRCPRRCAGLGAVARGGRPRGLALAVVRARAEALPLAPGAVDGALALELLEHLPDPDRAARELLRVARRFVLVSVPSKPDDNPEHLRVFSPAALEALFVRAGARRVSIEHVLDHRLALAFVP